MVRAGALTARRTTKEVIGGRGALEWKRVGRGVRQRRLLHATHPRRRSEGPRPNPFYIRAGDAATFVPSSKASRNKTKRKGTIGDRATKRVYAVFHGVEQRKGQRVKASYPATWEERSPLPPLLPPPQLGRSRRVPRVAQVTK